MRTSDEHDNHGDSLSPDYSDPHLRAALVHFIAALGTRYDGEGNRSLHPDRAGFFLKIEISARCKSLPNF